MDKLFGLDAPAVQEELAFLHTFYDDISSHMARELLQNEQIPFLAKDRGTGNVMRIIAGFSLYGVDFFVRREDLERASDLITALFSQDSAPEELPEDDDAPEDEDVDDLDDGDCEEGA